MAVKSDKDALYAILKIQKRIHTTVMHKEDTNDDEETNMIKNEAQTKIKTDMRGFEQSHRYQGEGPKQKH